MTSGQATFQLSVRQADRPQKRDGHARLIGVVGIAMVCICNAAAAQSRSAVPRADDSAFLAKDALMCLSLESFARGLVVRKWNNGPLPADCTISVLEKTPLSSVRESPESGAAFAAIASTGATAVVESFYVHIPALRRVPIPPIGDPTQLPRVVDEISYFDDFNLLQLTNSAKESERESGIRVYI